MQHCPVCEASLTEQSQCPRCGSDLSILLAIQTQSRLNLIAALQRTVKRDYKLANLHLKTAGNLYNDAQPHSIKRLLTRQNSQQLFLYDTNFSRIYHQIWSFCKRGHIQIIERLNLSAKLNYLKRLFKKYLLESISYLQKK